MESVSKKVLEQAIRLLGKPELSQEEIETRLRDSGLDEMVTHRLTTFIPEAFGMVAALQMTRKPAFQSTFKARNEDEESMDIPFSSEPIFGMAKSRAEMMYEEGGGPIFEAVSKRSSVTEVITDAIENKSFYEGVVVAIESEVPAEVYLKKEKAAGDIPFWRKVLGELVAVEVEYAEVVLWGLARWGRNRS